MQSLRHAFGRSSNGVRLLIPKYTAPFSTCPNLGLPSYVDAEHNQHCNQSERFSSFFVGRNKYYLNQFTSNHPNLSQSPHFVKLQLAERRAGFFDGKTVRKNIYIYDLKSFSKSLQDVIEKHTDSDWADPKNWISLPCPVVPGRNFEFQTYEAKKEENNVDGTPRRSDYLIIKQSRPTKEDLQKAGQFSVELLLDGRRDFDTIYILCSEIPTLVHHLSQFEEPNESSGV